ncbi:hypothetical protein P3L51_11250 [Streptomyces sp. PSRA5]|uniref:hypothetical protein n=1 Tax=Streptomyces panacea TaxID=3035064 RepID=UPI00339BE5F2
MDGRPDDVLGTGTPFGRQVARLDRPVGSGTPPPVVAALRTRRGGAPGRKAGDAAGT